MRTSFLSAIALIAGASSVLGQRARPSSAVLTVAQLYRDFAWEAVVEEPEWRGHDLLDQPRTVLARYFDQQVVDLLLADQACESRTHQHCGLGTSPIWASQDPAATELKVLPTEDSSVVVVKFRYPSNGESIELRYQLLHTGTGWRIHDISQGSRWSLLALLSGKH